jgi:hypothetical protein
MEKKRKQERLHHPALEHETLDLSRHSHLKANLNKKIDWLVGVDGARPSLL